MRARRPLKGITASISCELPLHDELRLICGHRRGIRDGQSLDVSAIVDQDLRSRMRDRKIVSVEVNAIRIPLTLSELVESLLKPD